MVVLEKVAISPSILIYQLANFEKLRCGLAFGDNHPNAGIRFWRVEKLLENVAPDKEPPSTGFALKRTQKPWPQF